jgi:hypothetical protein
MEAHMHRFGWIFIALGALMLFGRGGFFFLPLFFFWPLMLFLPMLFFGRMFGGPWRGYGRGGMRPYYWRGQHGYYSRGSCGGYVGHDDGHDTPPTQARGPYTGETTRL